MVGGLGWNAADVLEVIPRLWITFLADCHLNWKFYSKFYNKFTANFTVNFTVPPSHILLITKLTRSLVVCAHFILIQSWAEGKLEEEGWKRQINAIAELSLSSWTAGCYQDHKCKYRMVKDGKI